MDAREARETRREGGGRSRVLTRYGSHAQIGELARRLIKMPQSSQIINSNLINQSIAYTLRTMKEQLEASPGGVTDKIKVKPTIQT